MQKIQVNMFLIKYTAFCNRSLMFQMPTPIGIDLGTTFSVIACYRKDRVEIISDRFSQRLVPSMVYYNPVSGETCVGRKAYNDSRQCPPNLLRGTIKFIFSSLSLQNRPNKIVLM